MSSYGLLAYGLLALPLAAAALPIYLHLPRLYGADLGMDLALLGALLLALRLADAFTDPLLGALADRQQHRGLWIGGGMAMLAAGSLLAFHPTGSREWLPAWLVVSLLLLHLGYSVAGVHYLAWGSLLGATPHERTRVAAWRESFSLAGVMAASVLPLALGGSTAEGLGGYSFFVAVAALACTAATLKMAPRPAPPPAMPAPSAANTWASLWAPLRNPAFRRLLAVFMLNGIASALPATLVLFFIADVLHLSSQAGAFLAAYFAAGALSMPLWLALSARMGKRRSWFASMLLAVAAFAGAALLQRGDFAGFLLVCLASGIALGADLCLPPALLADVIRQDGRDSSAGAHAGLWTFATKLNLALAAGLALPLLQWSGYAPGGAVLMPLVWAYCLVPCVMKLASAVLLAWPQSSIPGAPAIATTGFLKEYPS